MAVIRVARRLFSNKEVLGILISAILVLLATDNARAIRWLGLKSAGSVLWNTTAGCRQARLHYGFNKRQVKLCRSTPDSMQQVIKAASSTVQACQDLLQDRRWNCSSIERAPHFTPDLTGGTREQAFVYALSSAAIAYVVARACASGAMFHCACATPPRDPPDSNFKWGGCGDNFKFGSHFARQFIDSADKYRQKKKQKGKKRHKLISDNGTDDDQLSRDEKRLQILSLVNLHNNRVGRRAVINSLTTQCKCHGVSGSCNVKTCWKALPPRLHDIGSRLLRQYAKATEVRPNAAEIGRKLLPVRVGPLYNQDDLIYVTKSPDYCHRDHRVGSVGTYGSLCNPISYSENVTRVPCEGRKAFIRQCNATMPGYASCDNMCCGRGYMSQMIEKYERCHCKYVWCCYVKCKTCRTMVQVNQCN